MPVGRASGVLRPDLGQSYTVAVKIGYGFTYSKYNTLMHFLNVVECYWHNPDLTSIQARVGSAGLFVSTSACCFVLSACYLASA